MAFSEQVGVGDVLPVDYFGSKLVLYRDDKGDAHLLDAFCPHMGAHLGYGNTKVDGNCIVCPFHGWAWNHEGRNENIPYHSRPNNALSIPVWEVRELDGLILAWFDATGAGPSWEPPGVPEFEDGKLADVWVSSTRIWSRVPTVAQVQIENLADFAHFKAVHGSPSEAELLSLSFEGPICRSDLNYEYSSSRGQTRIGKNELESWGLGVVIARHDTLRPMVASLSMTPIDAHHCDMALRVAVRLEDGETSQSHDVIVEKLMHAEMGQVEGDVAIFSHMRYIEKPPTTPMETKGFHAVRAWARQFYPVA